MEFPACLELAEFASAAHSMGIFLSNEPRLGMAMKQKATLSTLGPGASGSGVQPLNPPYA